MLLLYALKKLEVFRTNTLLTEIVAHFLLKKKNDYNTFKHNPLPKQIM